MGGGPTHHRQTHKNSCPFLLRLQFACCVGMVVVHANNPLKIPIKGAYKYHVGRDRTLGIDTFLPCLLNRWSDHINLLPPEAPAFPSVNVQCSHRDPGITMPHSLQRAVQFADAPKDSIFSNEIRDRPERDVFSYCNCPNWTHYPSDKGLCTVCELSQILQFVQIIIAS